MWWRNVTLIYAIVFTAIGIAGFIPGLVTAPLETGELAVEGMHGLLFGLFPVNWLHSLVHLAFGVWGFFAYFSGRYPSRGYLKSVAVIYGVLTVMGLIPVLNTTFGLVPLYGNDIWLHALLAIVAGAVAWGVSERETETASRRGV